MFPLNGGTKIYLYRGPADMRRSFDGLGNMVVATWLSHMLQILEHQSMQFLRIGGIKNACYCWWSACVHTIYPNIYKQIIEHWFIKHWFIKHRRRGQFNERIRAYRSTSQVLAQAGR